MFCKIGSFFLKIGSFVPVGLLSLGLLSRWVFCPGGSFVFGSFVIGSFVIGSFVNWVFCPGGSFVNWVFCQLGLLSLGLLYPLPFNISGIVDLTEIIEFLISQEQLILRRLSSF